VQSIRKSSFALAAVAWLGLGVLSTGPLPLTLPGALVSIAALVAAVAGALAVAVARGVVRVGHDAAERDARLCEAGMLTLPLFLALARVSGGASSAAVVAVAVSVLAIGRSGEIRWAAIAAGVALLALLAPMGVPRDAASLAIATALVVGLGVVPSFGTRTGPAAAATAPREADAESRRISLAARRTPGGTSAVARVLRNEMVRAYAEEAQLRYLDTMGELLGDVRDLHGADLAVFWRFTPLRDRLVATGWSGGGDAPEMAGDWAPHVEWAAREALPALDRVDGPPSIAAVPVFLGNGEILGALSLHGRGLRSPAERLRTWLPRHAVQLGRTAALLETIRDHSREGQRTNAILGAVQQFQGIRDEVGLAGSICHTALQVTSGDRAMLVHWDREEAIGWVVHSVGEQAPDRGTVVSAESLVGERCESAMPQVWEDARWAVADRCVLAEDEPQRPIGALGIYPLRNRAREVHGAIIVEGAAPESVLIRDMRNVALLGGYASLALETVWELAQVTHSSRTDQLTGLYNRRYFEERLGIVRAEFARHQQPCSVIVADVDFFKKVNDTYGHDAGDAVLRAVAATFRENVRAIDLCARFGGEEIAVLLPNTTIEGALESAERLRNALERRTIRHATREIQVTASFGVATFPTTSRTWESLFNAADRALYEAKRSGRNCVRSAEPVATVTET
jgi:diguanylate cyclase (GGDEF)-like protein